MSINITGLEQLNRHLDDAQLALQAAGGELGTVEFDPADPASIDMAIQQIEAIVDGKLGAYASNPIIGPIVEQMKERYRVAIVEKAAAVRANGSEG